MQSLVRIGMPVPLGGQPILRRKVMMLVGVLQVLRKILRDYKQRKFRGNFPLKGYKEHLNKIEFLDSLSDADLVELNNILSWNCFMVDRHGRRFGNAAWDGKRSEPEIIPDKRIILLNDCFDLSDKHVLEIGCFEGVHTIGLSRYARKVTAVDARIDNVVKTIVRCSFFGYHPTVFKCNVEERPLNFESLRADVAYHVGLLYHLKDPVQHLLELGMFIQRGLLLDTHYALDEEARETYEMKGKRYCFKRYREAGSAEVFSGVYDHSRWLKLEDIVEAVRAAGFGKVDILETRNERNGPRALLIAERN